MINKKAFTLAEVLITLTVIGVMAVLLFPVLRGGVNEKTLAAQKDTFDGKLKEGLRNMQIKGALAEDYTTTEDFVNAMKKYINIIKVCTADKLEGCMSEKIKADKKTVKFDMSKISTSTDIGSAFETESDLMGVVFADGTSALIAHDPDCIILNKYDATEDLTECFSMLYDVNGKDYPNVMNTDVFSINLGEVPEDSGEDKDPYGLGFNIESKGSVSSYNDAITACGGENKILSQAQAKKIAQQAEAWCSECTPRHPDYSETSGNYYYDNCQCNIPEVFGKDSFDAPLSGGGSMYWGNWGSTLNINIHISGSPSYPTKVICTK